MSYIEHKVKRLTTVDLTGEKPIYESHTLVEKVPVIQLEDDEEKEGQTNDDMDCGVSDKSVICEVCQQRISKYTCPACSKKTCCLLCVQNHKSQTGCNGTREKTAFIMKSKLNNIHLLNDYRFLEEVDRINDNAKRDYKVKQPSNQIGKQGFLLRKACKESKVKLFRMAKGMTRFKENRSRFHIREETIYWTVKFVFSDINNLEILDKFSENQTFEEILSPYLDTEKCPHRNSERFSPYLNRGADDRVHILFKYELNCEPGNKKFSVVDITKTIKESLSGKSVLEYPIYHVVLSKNAEKLLREPFRIKQEDSEALDTSPSPDSSIKSPEAKRRKVGHVQS